ncbi:MAG: tRNA1(Val) (adenine(37)-N6)-methyltransferase [bacterium]
MLTINQKDDGYRYTIDSFMLADFSRCSRGDRVIDLGTGCGIIPLLLNTKYKDLTIYGVDIQKELIEIADQNRLSNTIEHHAITFLNKDILEIKHLWDSGYFNVVVTNPPYYKQGSGRINSDNDKAKARHEISASITDFISAASYLLNNGGKFFTIFPVERLIDLTIALRELRLEPKRIRLISSTSLKPPHLLLLEAKKNSKPGLTIEAPLNIYREQGKYSTEIEHMFNLVNKTNL